MLRRTLSASLLLAAVTSVSYAQSSKIDFAEKVLPNGLRVVSVEDFSTPVVAVQVWYHVGSKDENPQRQGFAHMFEHMMFRGTDRLGPKAHFELIRKVGGDNNAYTSFDNTTYVQKLPSSQLELAFYLEAERMAFLKIDDDSFFTERAVVEEERRLGLNKPFGTVPEKLVSKIFTKHPYQWMPIGQIPMLRKANINELARFWETYYVPNNATLVIVGAVKNDDAQKLAAQYFGWIPKGENPPRVTDMEPPQTKERDIAITDPKAPITIVGLGYRGVSMVDPDAVALDVLMQVAGGGESSPIYQDIVKKQKLGVSAGAGAYGLEQDGLAGVFAVLPPMGGNEEAKKKAFDSLAAQVEKLKATPVTPEELDKAKTILLKAAVDSATTVEGKAQLIGTYAVLYGDTKKINDRFDQIRKVTADDLQRVAKKYFTNERLNKVTIEPAGAGEMLKSLMSTADDGPAATKPTTNAVAERTGPKATAVRPANFPTTAPVAKLDPTIPLPKKAEKILANGLKVVVVENHNQPLVSMVLGLRFGSFVGKPGVPEMTATLLTQGTKKHTSLQLADELEKNAIGLGASVGDDVGTVSANSLTEKSDIAMKLMAEVVREPTFPADEVDQAKTQALSAMQVQLQQPEYLAERELSKHVWTGHPYSVSTSTADIEAVKRDDLPAWWNEYVRPDTTVLYVAGDLTPDAAFALAEKYYGDWKSTGPMPAIAATKSPEKSATKIYLVDKPGSVQSQIRVGQVGLDRTNPDYPVARVLTQIFGGSFNSRLNESIRVKKGLTYGANGYFTAQRFGGAFTVSTFTKTPTTAETVRAILDEVNTLKNSPITPAELDDSKNFLVGSFAGQRERPEAILNDLWLIEYMGLPANYLQQNLAGVAATSDADVLRVARDVIDPGHFVIVVVGDAKKVKESLEKIAPVEVVDPSEPTTAPATLPVP